MPGDFEQVLDNTAIIVWFAYGLVFFTLGLAIALQSRNHSRLELARNLGWLAAFGVAHGLHEWGTIFVPIQATYLSAAAVSFLMFLQTILLALSFAFLFQFGAELLRRRWPWLTALPLALFMAWLFVFFLPGLIRSQEPAELRVLASIWARYLLATPAGLLSALGMVHHINSTIRPLGFRSIGRMMYVASLALLAYSLIGGLVVPPADFFPANRLNDRTFTAWMGVTPPVMRSITGLVLVVAVIRTLEVFDIEVNQIIEEMQVERGLAEERERIARELHDGTIQTIYTAGLLVESAESALNGDDEAAGRLKKAGELLNESIANLRGYIGNLQPAAETESLEAVIRQQAEDVRLSSLVQVQVDIACLPDEPMNPGRLPHVSAFLKEALSNAARHSGGRRIRVKADCEGGQFILHVQDNGRGFDPSHAKAGYGLRNMRDRARLLGGSLVFDAHPGQGTSVELRVPWTEDV